MMLVAIAKDDTVHRAPLPYTRTQGIAKLGNYLVVELILPYWMMCLKGVRLLHSERMVAINDWKKRTSF